MDGENLIGRIREANLAVYRASPSRLREDVGSEAEIAHDYQGRLIFELLQNADDAMNGEALGRSDRIKFRLTDHELLVMNSGRPLSAADVRGLTSTGASSKTASPTGGHRASIGHKGMGFKSVLEITERPEVYSSTFAFSLDANRALPEVQQVLVEVGEAPPDRVPIMRFPWECEAPPASWAEAHEAGFNVLFRFPFREDVDRDKIRNLADSLLELPATTILFLKHLEKVEIEVQTASRSGRLAWSVTRERRDPSGWQQCDGLTGPGLYQVWIESDGDSEIWCFLLAHEDEIKIGRHRGGLNEYAWGGVDLTEVTVGALLTGGEQDDLPPGWGKFHVFLPTAETSGYPLLVNGAFATDLSRQEIRVLPEAEDYNRYLISCAAALLTDVLLPAVTDLDGGVLGALRLLARTTTTGAERDGGDPSGELHRAVVAALADSQLVPTSTSTFASIPGVAIPATLGHPSLGAEIRALLPDMHAGAGSPLPVGGLCAEPFASILIDHGARALSPAGTAALLSGASPERTRLQDHPSGKIRTDPVLGVLQTLWELAGPRDREQLERCVRSEPLFPVSLAEDGTVQRIAVGPTETFFPPRALRGAIPLHGLRFMLADLCWGTLTPRERTEELRAAFPAWTALYQIREFKFPDVMRVSILPALALDATAEQRGELENWSTLTAVCQLAGASPSPDAPLPYGRLGPQRALFNLCRMPVPCLVDGIETWVPAYRAYFGSAWIGDAAIEPLISAVALANPTAEAGVPILVDPGRFVDELEKMRSLAAIAQADESDSADDVDEVDVDEDDEQATEADAKERWLAFLTWLGVNHVLRPVHFHDAEDRAKGWVSTRGLDRPTGVAFRHLGGIWGDYVEQLQRRIPAADRAENVPYFYRLHDLERLAEFCDLAADDATCTIASALFGHLAANWRRLERFTEVELALLGPGVQPARRTDPPRADAKELRRFGPDLWLFRLRRASFCPTEHGPRQPQRTWWRSSEVERRFGRRGSPADRFLPVLTEAATAHDARKFSEAVGIRIELTPALFTPGDAVALAKRIEDLFSDEVELLTPDAMRTQINPVYQNLFELLSGSATDRNLNPEDLDALHQSRLLVHDGSGHYRFDFASQILYAPRGGLREIYGINDPLWTFVLEGRPAVIAPLQRLFGARDLEDALDWVPNSDECPLDQAGLEQFRSGLREVAPYLLARLRVERAEEDRAARDAARLRQFVECVEPVAALSATCSLDGNTLHGAGERLAFVKRSGKDLTALVRWGENPWPPDSGEAEALATALTEVLEVGYFEPLLALLITDGPGRTRLLGLAGASGNLPAAEADLRTLDGLRPEVDPGVVPGGLPSPTPGESIDHLALDASLASLPGPAAAQRTRLVALDTLTLDGDPISETGNATPRPPDRLLQLHPRGASTTQGPSRAYGGGTDLDELNRLGMCIASAFELRRLQRLGHTATIFDADEPLASDAVFDVSTPAAIALAAEVSTAFATAMEALQERGVARDVPGFDILTLRVDQQGTSTGDELDRLIELKSSGVNARTQQMTWNEWKTATTGSLRSHFFLYLVGNLRADLDVSPFIRAIQDPYGQLISTVTTGQTPQRSVKLDIASFHTAELLELTRLR